jgi:two-component sensor histidine kinase
VASFAVLTTGLVGFAIYEGRHAALAGVEDRTRSVARMISAHGDAAIADASTVMTAIEERIRVWDLRDGEEGRALFTALRDLILGGPHLSSAWVVDATGQLVLNTWSFPPAPTDASDRTYFRRHVESGDDGDLLAGTERGAVTGNERFTVSRALRAPDGSLHAIVVVGILSDEFDTLYADAATWPEARAGLYTLNGDVLARLSTENGASPAFVAAMNASVVSEPSGTAIINDGRRRLASWHRSELYPEVFATSSQTIATALAAWRRTSAALVGLGVAAIAGFGLLAVASVRAAEARDAARVRGLAIREVHHRVKNALQLIISMTSLRARQTEDPAARAELEHLAAMVRSLAAIEDMLQNTRAEGAIDVYGLLRTLCDRLGPAFGGEIRLSGDGELLLPASTATSIAIIVNELLLNAIKFGSALVTVEVAEPRPGRLAVTVSDDGPGLPSGFAVRRPGGSGFGLTAARSMARSLDGTVSAETGASGGARFRLDVAVPRAGAEALLARAAV